MKGKTLIVITGPTASGKSALAIDTALRLGTEIVSADSRQIYHGIPISTAMPSAEELAAVPHHLIDMLPLDAYYSSGMFEQDALKIIGDIFKKSDYAILCGGSMMYVDAVCSVGDRLPQVSPEIRQTLHNDHQAYGDDWLRMRLYALDPDYYHKVDLMNIKRVFHAVELSLQAKAPYSSLLTGRHEKREFNIVKAMIDMPRDVLFDRINRRVDIMVTQGMEEEARSVYALRHLNSLNTVGLKEWFAHFDGTLDRETAIQRIKRNTRVYAKKQLTWYQRDPSIIHLTGADIHSQLLSQLPVY